MLKLKVVQEQGKLLFYDISYNVSVNKIDSLLIVVKGISSGIAKTFDCQEYIANRRVYNEILEVNGTDFGFDLTKLPDDVYRCKMILNGQYEHEVYIYVKDAIMEKLEYLYSIYSQSIDTVLKSNEMLTVLDLYKTSMLYNLLNKLIHSANKMEDIQIIDVLTKIKKLSK